MQRIILLVGLTVVAHVVGAQETSEIIEAIVNEGQVELIYKAELTQDLSLASAAELRILRNLLYAKHGYSFRSDDLRAHFGRFEWYRPTSRNVDHLFSLYEKLLLAMILDLEGRAWIGVLSDADFYAILAKYGRFTWWYGPGMPATDCPCYYFDRDGSFSYNPGYDEDGVAVRGVWRVKNARLQIQPREVYIDDFVATENPPDEWIDAGGFSKLSFPRRAEAGDFVEVGAPHPAALSLANLIREGRRVMAAPKGLFLNWCCVLLGER